MTRTLLHEVDDLSMHGGNHQLGGTRRAPSGRLEQVSRRLAARRTADALEIFEDLPAIRQDTVEHARRTFAEWQQRAVAELDELDTRSGEDAHALRARQVHTLAQAASSRELAELVESGLLPEQVLRSTGTAQTDHPR